MKNIFTYTLLLILTFSCNQNAFSDTEMFFLTDEASYRVNDNFEITAIVSPKSGEKKIRIKKNLDNLKISFHASSTEQEFSQELKKNFIEGPSLTTDESQYIDEFTISKTQPFKKTFKGLISESKESIILEIPELNIIDSVAKSELLVNPKIIIKGNFQTIFSVKEEYFTPKDINILIE